MPVELTDFARSRPDHTAFGVVGGEATATRSYADLEARSEALARALAGAGLRGGDTVAVLMDNVVEYADAVWAALRSGLRVAPTNVHLATGELATLLGAARPRALLVSADREGLAAEALAAAPEATPAVVLGTGTRFDSLDDAIATAPADAPVQDAFGARLSYSSGTTGLPKAIAEPLPETADGEPPPIRLGPLMEQLSLDADAVVLSPGPCYHTAPFGFMTTAQRIGATALTMPRFDAERCVDAVLEHGVTHLHVVPTMVVRMLRLPEGVRARLRDAGLRAVIFGGAPCSPDVKAATMAWLGPIAHEYYGASEGYGQTHAGPDDAIARPGTVGRAVRGTLHVTDEDGMELAVGEHGTVWFEGTPAVTYVGDDERTAAARDARGWSTVGDVGYLDDDGFLYLTGRRGQMVVSGGVNIEPQEVEDVLVGHPAVADAGAFGVDDEELGERLVALVEPTAAADRATLPDALREHCRERLARFKCPRELRVVDDVPRSAAGKLLVERARATFHDASR